MTASGQSLFNPSFGDLTLEAFARVQIRPAALTADHMRQATLSAQLVLVDFAVEDGPNLWKQQLLSAPLVQGTATYAIPSTVIAITDWFVRQYELNAALSLAPNFSTIINTPTVTVRYANHGMAAGNWIAIIIPVAVGGLVLLGFYAILSVVDLNTFTITAPQNATSTVNNAGTVPSFTTTASSATVTVALTNHGLSAGQNFTIEAPTAVGGLTLSGVYPVVTATANSFTIAAPQPAGSSATVAENAGQAQIALQDLTADPQDRTLFPISRSEYAQQPDKTAQAFPSTVFFLRTINPTFTLWQVPDGGGPYVMYYWAVVQIQDAVLAGGVTMDLPYRFFDAFAAALAARLARKYPPPPSSGVSVNDLKLEAAEAWQKAAKQDTEEGVPLYITPGLSSYYR